MKRLLLLLCLAMPVGAQTEPVKIKVTSPSCVGEGQRLEAILRDLRPAPAWTWYVICDEKTWAGLSRKIPKIDARTFAFAHFPDKKVFLKVAAFERHDLRFIIAHEVAHILLGPHGSEKQADELAHKLLSVLSSAYRSKSIFSPS